MEKHYNYDNLTESHAHAVGDFNIRNIDPNNIFDFPIQMEEKCKIYQYSPIRPIESPKIRALENFNMT